MRQVRSVSPLPIDRPSVVFAAGVFRNGAGIIRRTPRKVFPDPRGKGIDVFAVKLCLTGSSACTLGFAAVGVAKALRFRAFNGFRLG